MDFIPHTDTDTQAMLEVIGVKDVDDLLQAVPKALRAGSLGLPAGVSEADVIREMEALGRRNRTTKELVSFLGAGSYEHFIPSALPALVMRGEFVTAYTPYQAEASQGSLQAIYEFQTMLCELTGLDVANASLYEGASALAEAALLALRHTNRSTLVVSSSVHPEYREVVKTYLEGLNVRLIEAPAPKGVIDTAALRELVNSDTAAVMVQTPNFYGCLEPVREVESVAHGAGALFLVSVNPMSLGALESPGAYGADVATGEAHVFGNPMWYGGPYVGFMAARKELVRKMPGRIAGMTTDRLGKRGFVLTLQTREQHIRRQRATSNICTNEALCALAVTVYLALVGKEGLKEIAYQNVAKSHYLQERLCGVPGVRLTYDQPFFNEFALTLPMASADVLPALEQDGFLGGVPLARFDASRARELLLCVTETKTREDLDRFIEAMERALR